MFLAPLAEVILHKRSLTLVGTCLVRDVTLKICTFSPSGAVIW